MSEEAIIQGYFRDLSRLPGAYDLVDDCGALEPGPGQQFVFKTDPIREGVHFTGGERPEDIAWKAIAVNVSDLAAKGARPVAYLLAVSFPQQPAPDWLGAFARGLQDAQTAFGLSLIGGDTDRAPGPISLAPTVIGELPAGRMIRRAGARAGDLIYVSGALGGAAIGLKLQSDDRNRELLGLPAGLEVAARQRYLRPEPRLGLRAALLRFASGAMDLSDGLNKDLGRMARASSCGADVTVDRIPAAPELQAARISSDLRMQLLLGHGDDYEVLTAVPPDNADAFERVARNGGVNVTKIGIFTKELGVSIRSEDGMEVTIRTDGYDHF